MGGAEGFARLGSLRPIPLPGGDLCTKQIGRVTHALLWEAGLSEDDSMLTRQLKANLNCPRSSGMGRLFDGVYALLTGRETVTYEGQGAILLEAMAESADFTLPTCFYGGPMGTQGELPHRGKRGWPGPSAPTESNEKLLIFDWRPMIRALWEHKQNGVPAEQLATAFMDALVQMGLTQCCHARENTGLNRVVLSGGVFQNMYLLPHLLDALAADGFEVYHHSRVSANDEGIALGQLVIADAMLRKEAL